MNKLRYTNPQKLQIVKQIKKYRANGLTLVKAAEKAGVSYTTYANWRDALVGTRTGTVARRTIGKNKSRTATGRISRRAA